MRIGFTYPEDKFGVSRRPLLWPAVRVGLYGLRATFPARIPRLLRRAGATTLMLNHALVTPRAVAAARRSAPRCSPGPSTSTPTSSASSPPASPA